MASTAAASSSAEVQNLLAARDAEVKAGNGAGAKATAITARLSALGHS